MENTRSRYPGAAPFTDGRHQVFYGRNRELDMLEGLLASKDQLLLYSKSGVGKSSLLEAGLRKRIEDRNNGDRYIPIRFGNYVKGEAIKIPLGNLTKGEPIVNPLENQVKGEMIETPLANRMQVEPSETPLQNLMRRVGDPVTPTILANLLPEFQSLWSRFKTQQTDQKIVHYLVFDQFEELFSYPESQINEFKIALAEVLSPYIPHRFQQRLQLQQDEGEVLLTDRQIQQLYEPLNVKVLVAIREDRLSDILQLNDYLPELRHNFFHLKPLDRVRAREAIEKPAMEEGAGFDSQPFTITPNAVDRILDFLTGMDESAESGQRQPQEDERPIETTQLQIICQQIERMRMAWTDPERTIFHADELPSFSNIMTDFYHAVLSKFHGQHRKEVERFIETSLIFGNQRIPVAGPICLEKLGKETLDSLVREHIIRAEPNSTRGQSYELSHDNLVEPILRMKQERQRVENAEKLAAQEESIRKDRRRLRVTQFLLFISVLAVIAAVWFGVDAERNKIIAEDAVVQSKKNADAALANEQKAQDAERELRELIGKTIDDLKIKAQNLHDSGNNPRAIERLQEAQKLDPTRQDIAALLAQWK